MVGSTLRYLTLFLLYLLLSPGFIYAAAPQSAAVVETSGDYLNLAEHHDGYFELSLAGEQVAATLTTARSPVRDWGRDPQAPLFTVPEGFRPPFSIVRLVVGHPVQADGTPFLYPPAPRSFLLQIDADGAVRYADDGWVAEVSYFAYNVHTVWGTTPAANDQAVLAILDDHWFDETTFGVAPRLKKTDLAEFKTERRFGSYVVFDPEGRVTDLGSPGSDFNGPLRPELGQLHKLEHLDLGYLSFNHGLNRREEIEESLSISGRLPKHIGPLTGQIPPELGQLVNLRHLDLGGHLLTGAIPPELGNLAALEYLGLSSNWLSGSVPSSLGQLTNLKNVQLQDNQLTGCLPWSWNSDEMEVDSLGNVYSKAIGRGLHRPLFEPLPLCSGEITASQTAVQEYVNPTVNWGGQVQLEVQGKSVYITMQTVRSPVQYLARQQPDVLFTVPEGFRPAMPMTWEVTGWHVGEEGKSDPARREVQVFRMQVDSDGHVRYVNDAGVDGVGYLRYRTNLAWPLAGTNPQVCDRSPAVQTAILASLEPNGSDAIACEQVDWNALKGINGLEIDAYEMSLGPNSNLSYYPFKSGDLVGLSGLNKLQIYHDFVNADLVIEAQFPSRFLAHVPQLRDLHFRNVKLVRLPPDFLTNSPNLLSLFLDVADSVFHLPVGFLSQTSRLQFLHLILKGPYGLGGPISLPSDFLADSAQLKVLRMYLAGESLSELPSDFLADTPNLEILTLEVFGNGSLNLPPQFLGNTPNLKEARIWAHPHVKSEPLPVLDLAGHVAFLDHAPQLMQLWLKRVDIDPKTIGTLPTSAKIHWVLRDDVHLPEAEILALEPSRHVLHVSRVIDGFPSEATYSGLPLNIVVYLCGEASNSLEDWLARHAIQDLTAVIFPGCREPDVVLKKLFGLTGQIGLQRLSVLTSNSMGVSSHWLKGQAFDWLHLDRFANTNGFVDFFDRFSAKVLLLSRVTSFNWTSQKESNRKAVRTLMQAPRVQHLGLVLHLRRVWSREFGWQDGVWILPPGLFDDLGYECIDIDLRFQKGEILPVSVRTDLENLGVDVQIVSGESAVDQREPWTVSLWDTHWFTRWLYQWDGLYYDHFLWNGERNWFEEDHLTWARAQNCNRSIFLRFQGGEVPLEAGILSHPGHLQHLRIILPAASCRDCSTR